MLGQIVTVTVDRKMGTRHPHFPELVYPVNYGYIRGISAPDGEDQDAYIHRDHSPKRGRGRKMGCDSQGTNLI